MEHRGRGGGLALQRGGGVGAKGGLASTTQGGIDAPAINYLISAGVRQGGVLSPLLFAVYVDELILSLYKLGFGCHIGIQCMSVLMYADDLVLLSGSLSGLQAMINLCVDKLTEFDLQINVKKSICLRIGKCHNNICSDLNIGGVSTSWSKNLTYLGITLSSSAKFAIDLKQNRVKFYRAFNSIYSKISKANELLSLTWSIRTVSLPLCSALKLLS